MYNMGEPRIKIVAMPKDTNPAGNIFGGWIMSQIDIAGSLAARDLNVGRVVTVAVNSMEFREAVKVGDVLSCYAKIIKVGTSSITTQVEVNAERSIEGAHRCLHVTSAVITYVNVTPEGKKTPIPYTENELLALGIERKQ
ncbi:MAG: acyl-CoA thioesterase [Sulfurospirillum sp.]|jgi:acyl-CoA thioesterase YciA|uniref:acyl-CoA thioesterase n=1 Tax=Sulfurospirillum sp. UCH001 TaxID=1581011 RepID=UPI00082AB6E1|nr:MULTISPECIES: acyl-CoA thioesterase [unclassified Sulfurospirillum]WNY99612.1 acyl-CoA thioesterase [Sulfurospirillum sp. 'SP']